MSNYLKYNNKILFHPGYYIKELIDTFGITRKDFAEKLKISTEDLDSLIKGEKIFLKILL